MAWSDPKTWTADDLLTASDLNQYVSDNLSALYALVQGGGRKNLLHNGAMQVYQRGASSAGNTTSGYYTADRWVSTISSIGTWTQSIEADAPTGSGFRKSLKMLCTTADASPAAGDVHLLSQRIEGQNLQSIKKGTASAEPITLSFWTKSNKTGTYVVELADADNTRAVSATYTVASSGTWEQQSVTFPADLTGAFNNDNELSVTLNFWLGAGTTWTSGTLATTWASTTSANRAVGQTNLAASTNNYWQVTGCQLETGSASTGFEFKGYEQELAECQRYYWRVSGNNQTIGPAFARTALDCYTPILFAVPMRGTAAIDVANSAGYYTASLGSSDYTFATLSFTNASSTGGLITAATTGMTIGYAGWLRCSNASSYVGFSADL